MDLSRHPDGCLIGEPESGPVFIEVTNRFGTLRVDLGDITLYDLPEFRPFDPRGLPRPEVPGLDAFTLEHMKPVLEAVPAVVVPEVPAVPSLPTADLIGNFRDTLIRGSAVPLPLPNLNDAVIEASRLVTGIVMDEATEYAAARRQEYLASQEEAGGTQP